MEAFRGKTYSPGEVAQRCGLPTRTVLAAIRSGELGAWQINRRVLRIPEADLSRWLDLLRERARGLHNLHN